MGWQVLISIKRVSTKTLTYLKGKRLLQESYWRKITLN